jgi:hypothetical protein
VKLRDSREHFAPMPEQDADLLEVLVGQVMQDRGINSILGKALCVLPKIELLKPIRNLLHRGACPDAASLAAV